MPHDLASDMRGVFLLALAVAALQEPSPPGRTEPADPESSPRVVQWGGRAFQTREDLSAWLAGRGVRYEVWASRHPRGAEALEGAPDPVPPRARLREAQTPGPPPDSGVGVPPSADGVPTWFTATAVVVAALLIGVSLLPGRRPDGRLAVFLVHWRLRLVTSAVSILLTLATVSILLRIAW